MVHALHEAYRVLKVGGRLIDLEPADSDRKVLACSGGAWHAIGKILVDDPDLRGAERALAQVVEQGFYRKISSRAFRVRRYCRTRRDWREYLDGLTVSKPEPGLVQKIDAGFKSRPDMQIALEFDLMLCVLKKSQLPRRSTAGLVPATLEGVAIERETLAHSQGWVLYTLGQLCRLTRVERLPARFSSRGLHA